MAPDAATDAGIFARSFEDCVVEIGVASGRVVGVSFPSEVPDDAASDHALLDRVEAYLRGTEDHFDDVQVALTVPTAQRPVLEAVRNVPYGETISVGRLARLAGLDPENDGDVEAVETALRENPAPLFVPDHRVEAPGATPERVARLFRAVES
ncbi:cysteine methyltransferase [Salinigranum rubrum]|uniref:Cysteine methyltransferase n=1 Tax=Salinigranum rubrum TaxID=755307 RepID=A0A2I8VJ15_9EURY|nr:MGMT family protein [Salinigranum rubrum]AUV81049.1 cysteine methyltransferase [Salinigranum rubrum]